MNNGLEAQDNSALADPVDQEASFLMEADLMEVGECIIEGPYDVSLIEYDDAGNEAIARITLDQSVITIFRRKMYEDSLDDISGDDFNHDFFALDSEGNTVPINQWASEELSLLESEGESEGQPKNHDPLSLSFTYIKRDDVISIEVTNKMIKDLKQEVDTELARDDDSASIATLQARIYDIRADQLRNMQTQIVVGAIEIA